MDCVRGWDIPGKRALWLFDGEGELSSYTSSDHVDFDLFGVGKLGVEPECIGKAECFSVDALDDIAGLEAEL
jgi:hypothetical protein